MYAEPEAIQTFDQTFTNGNVILGSIVNGRYDMFCPPITAWQVHKALPESKLYIIPDAGHSAMVRQGSKVRYMKCADS